MFVRSYFPKISYFFVLNQEFMIYISSVYELLVELNCRISLVIVAIVVTHNTKLLVYNKLSYVYVSI